MIASFFARGRDFLLMRLRNPLYSNAFALIGVQFSTSLLGFVFWIFLTHNLNSEKIGYGNALYSAAILLVSLAVIGMDDSLIYYLPRMEHPERLVNAFYSILIFLSLTISIVFIIGQPFWAKGLNSVHDSLFISAIFLFCIMIFQLSGCQDALFIADRVSKYTLYKGIFINIIRFPILYLILFLQETSLIFSAAISTLLGVVLFNEIYRRRENKKWHFQFEFSPTIWKPVIPFSFASYLTSMVSKLPSTILPLIILNHLGARANAYFAIAWLFPGIINVFGRAFGVSVFVESGRNTQTVPSNVKRSIRTASLLTIVIVIALSLIAPYLLLIFGKEYSLGSTTLVRLLAISNIPFTIYGILIGVLKSQYQLKKLMILGFVYSFTQISFSYVMIQFYGLIGVGWAILLAQICSLGFVVLLSYKSLKLIIKNGVQNGK